MCRVAEYYSHDSEHTITRVFRQNSEKSPGFTLLLQFVNRRHGDRSFHGGALGLQIMKRIFVDHKRDNCRRGHSGEVYA